MLEAEWDLWQGSPTEIARLAARAEAYLKWHFAKVPDHQIITTCTVGTPIWAGGPSLADLRDEIGARRSLVRRVEVESYAIVKGWPNDTFARVPMKRPPRGRRREPGVYVETETSSAPQRIELHFHTESPAVRLRAIAGGPMACANLFSHMDPHVKAGARPRVWLPSSAGAVGCVIGVAIPDVLLLAASLPPWWTVLLQIILGAVGWLSGWVLIEWAFPPLELVEAWERTRWQQVQTRTWQLLTLALAVAAIVLAVVLAQPAA